MIAQHSSLTNEHYTPPLFIEAARRCMGGIDLDPASSEQANKNVNAKYFYTAQQNAFTQAWFGRVWLNPPGGLCDRHGNTLAKGVRGLSKVDRNSSMVMWWKKLTAEYLAGNVSQAIFLGFTLEILRLGQAAPISTLSVPFCIPRERIDFLDEALRPQGAPTHSNVFLYLGPNVGAFEREFGAFGDVCSPQ